MISMPPNRIQTDATYKRFVCVVVDAFTKLVVLIVVAHLLAILVLFIPALRCLFLPPSSTMSTASPSRRPPLGDLRTPELAVAMFRRLWLCLGMSGIIANLLNMFNIPESEQSTSNQAATNNPSEPVHEPNSNTNTEVLLTSHERNVPFERTKCTRQASTQNPTPSISAAQFGTCTKEHTRDLTVDEPALNTPMLPSRRTQSPANNPMSDSSAEERTDFNVEHPPTSQPHRSCKRPNSQRRLRFSCKSSHSPNNKVFDSLSCEQCRDTGNEDVMLICDGCDNGYHMFCLQPPLESIPAGDWFCVSCTKVTQT
jgi:hypothetical protein